MKKTLNMIIDEIIKQLTEYEIIPITKQNFEQIFDVYASNHDFFLLVQGEKATIESSIGDIEAIPPNCVIEQKVYLSIWEDGKAIGVLDLIEGYPEQTNFWIGLLLIHGDLQSKKIGSKIVHAMLNAAKISGYKSAQLGVIENNVKGIGFWQKHGFGISRQSENIVVMSRNIV